jgi:hypothetical protein
MSPTGTRATAPPTGRVLAIAEYERMANWLAGGGRRARSTSSGAISPPLSVSVSRPAAGANHLKSREPGAVQPSHGWGEAVDRCACRAGWPLGRLLPRAAVFRATGSGVPRSGLHHLGWHYSARSTSAGLGRAVARPGQNATALAMKITAGTSMASRSAALHARGSSAGADRAAGDCREGCPRGCRATTRGAEQASHLGCRRRVFEDGR